MSSQNSFLSQIKEGTAVKVSIPLKGIAEKVRFPCFFGTTNLPEFSLRFPLDSLNFDQIDTLRDCTVMIDLANQTIAVAAALAALEPPCVIKLTAKKTITHTQTRNYFRVDASARVAASSLVPEGMAREGETWRLLGDTIDLSGSGLLCAFNEPLEKGAEVRIELTLPSREMDTIKAVGHVVRCKKIEAGLYHTALHFDMIDPESQDKIMACCFELQRRYLRMRVSLQRTEANK
ncbi:MAG: flagellar brake protein [Desulfobulbus sp.]